MEGAQEVLDAKPPEADFCAVGDDFLPGVQYDADPKYLAILSAIVDKHGDRDEAGIEFAKAMVLTDGQATRAARMVWPEIAAATQRKKAERYSHKPEIMALYTYFLSIRMNVSDQAVDRNEFINEIRKRWRSTPKDTAQFINLSSMLMQLEGLDKQSTAPDVSSIDMDLLLADECMAAVGDTDPHGPARTDTDGAKQLESLFESPAMGPAGGHGEVKAMD